MCQVCQLHPSFLSSCLSFSVRLLPSLRLGYERPPEAEEDLAYHKAGVRLGCWPPGAPSAVVLHDISRRQARKSQAKKGGGMPIESNGPAITRQASQAPMWCGSTPPFAQLSHPASTTTQPCKSGGRGDQNGPVIRVKALGYLHAFTDSLKQQLSSPNLKRLLFASQRFSQTPSRSPTCVVKKRACVPIPRE